MCGIFGFTSNNKDNWTALNRFKFQILGVEMDARGGDSTGIAYDNIVVKSHEIKLFNDFWRNSDNIPKSLQFPAIIGHDRKSSVGGNTYENAQPIFFQFDEANHVESILAHNGTISNYRELYEKHKLQVHYSETEIAAMSDSQVLALLLHKVGWSILEEYIGSAAFLYMRSSEPGIVYIYHGKSPTRKNAAETEERPLFYAIDEESECIWICSTRSAIDKVVASRKAVIEVPFNTVFRIEGLTMSAVAKIDRKDVYQFPAITTYSTVGYRQGEIDYGDDYYGVGMGGRSKNVGAEGAKSNTKVKSLGDDIDPYSAQKKIFYEAGVFKKRDTFAHTTHLNSKSTVIDGQILLRNGFLNDVLDPSSDSAFVNSYAIYFWRGNLCKGREAYLDCIKVENSRNFVSDFDLYQLVARNFALPYVVPLKEGEKRDLALFSVKEFATFYNGDGAVKERRYNRRFNGVFEPPLRVATFRFEWGTLVDVSLTGGKFMNFADMPEVKDSFPSEFRNDLEELMNSLPNQESKKNENSKLKLILPPATETAKNAEDDHKGDAAIEAESANKQYPCPTCCGEGYTSDSSFCPECYGTASVSEVEMQRMVDELTKEIEPGCRDIDRMTTVQAALDVVVEGMEVLEEFNDIDCESFLKLRKCKKILER